MSSDPLSIVSRVVQTLDAVGIRYVVGGSLAGSIYGIPRATPDADLVAEIRPSDVEKVAARLQGEFYADTAMMYEAIDRCTSFNLLHWETMFKADVFIRKEDAWSREQMRRGRVEQLETATGAVSIRFASAEDTVLHKLMWYKLGDEVSDRQWGDILGILKVQEDRLDHAYLNQWASVLGVADLLARARREE